MYIVCFVRLSTSVSGLWRCSLSDIVDLDQFKLLVYILPDLFQSSKHINSVSSLSLVVCYLEMLTPHLSVCPFSAHFNRHFPGGPGLARTRMSQFLIFIGAKGDGGLVLSCKIISSPPRGVSRGDGNNWSYKTCKAPVRMSPPKNNTQLCLYRPNAFPVAQPTVSKHCRLICCVVICDVETLSLKWWITRHNSTSCFLCWPCHMLTGSVG